MPAEYQRFLMLYGPSTAQATLMGFASRQASSSSGSWASLDLLSTWTLQTKAAANRRVIAVVRQRVGRRCRPTRRKAGTSMPAKAARPGGSPGRPGCRPGAPGGPLSHEPAGAAQPAPGRGDVGVIDPQATGSAAPEAGTRRLAAEPRVQCRADSANSPSWVAPAAFLDVESILRRGAATCWFECVSAAGPS
jgi:hypothetical protein